MKSDSAASSNDAKGKDCAAGDPGFAGIVERAGRLICTTPEFDDLAREVGLTPRTPKKPTESNPSASASGGGAVYGVTDPAERAGLRAELDGMVAHLYGLSEAEFEHVLATFPLVEQGVRDAALAEYRRLVVSGEAIALNPEMVGEEPDASLADSLSVGVEEGGVRGVIAAGESARVEFKSSARWDLRKGERADYIELSIVKTIAAFLNAKGGTLLIGVDDEGRVLGLADDYKTLGKKPDRDGFELWLMQRLLKEFGKDASAQIDVTFHAVDAAEVCRVEVAASPRPRFVVEKNQEVFYLRTGNQTQQLGMSELLAYKEVRWPVAAG